MLDIYLDRKSRVNCADISRRDFVRLGALAALGVTLPEVLRTEGRADVRDRKKLRARSVVLVFFNGGLSHLDSLDPKPEAPAEVRGVFKPIDTAVPGVQIGELLPGLARSLGRVALVRSASHGNDHHETATNWVLSGHFGPPRGDFPAMGAVATHQLGMQGVLPPYFAVPANPAFTYELGKSAFLGGRCESFKTGDPNSPQFQVRDVAPAEPITAAGKERRQSLLQTVDRLARQVHENDQIATYDEFHQRAVNLMLSEEARAAFAMDKEPAALRERYGRSTFGQSCLLARRLVERGVRFVTVNYGGWDHHVRIWEQLRHKLPEFDRGFAAFLDDLAERGLLQETLVLALGEFGRTPQFNSQRGGRDHWGRAASLLFAGAGVRGGQVIGETDKHGAFVKNRPVAPEDVVATVYEAIGVDPRQFLQHPEGRPIPILERGETIKELFT